MKKDSFNRGQMVVVTSENSMYSGKKGVVLADAPKDGSFVGVRMSDSTVIFILGSNIEEVK